MAVIVMAMIIFLALFFGAELGPKVNPTTTTYVPRPDWYFFFLFEVLRVMKNIPKFTDLATIGVPTLCMILLFLLPFYDRSAERRITHRPVALAAGLVTILAMAYLTWSGANTGSPNEVHAQAAVEPERRPEADVSAPARRSWDSRAAWPVTSSGPTATTAPVRCSPTSGTILRPNAIASTLRNPTAPMPSFSGLAEQYPKKFNDLVGFLSMLQ